MTSISYARSGVFGCGGNAAKNNPSAPWNASASQGLTLLAAFAISPTLLFIYQDSFCSRI